MALGAMTAGTIDLDTLPAIHIELVDPNGSTVRSGDAYSWYEVAQEGDERTEDWYLSATRPRFVHQARIWFIGDNEPTEVNFRTGWTVTVVADYTREASMLPKCWASQRG